MEVVLSSECALGSNAQVCARGADARAEHSARALRIALHALSLARTLTGPGQQGHRYCVHAWTHPRRSPAVTPVAPAAIAVAALVAAAVTTTTAAARVAVLALHGQREPLVALYGQHTHGDLVAHLHHLAHVPHEAVRQL